MEHTNVTNILDTDEATHPDVVLIEQSVENLKPATRSQYVPEIQHND